VETEGNKSPQNRFLTRSIPSNPDSMTFGLRFFRSWTIPVPTDNFLSVKELRVLFLILAVNVHQMLIAQRDKQLSPTLIKYLRLIPLNQMACFCPAKPRLYPPVTLPPLSRDRTNSTLFDSLIITSASSIMISLSFTRCCIQHQQE